MVRICSDVKCERATTAKYCGICGKGTIPLFLKCPHCQKEVSIRMNFCEECGKPVQEEVKAFVEKERKEVELNGSKS